MPSPADLLREFHTAFEVPIHDGVPTLDVPENDLRDRLLHEEYEEVTDAWAEDDIAAYAHELADLVYVAYGNALAYGFDLDDVLAEVHRANMSKLGADGRPVRRADGKVLKGPNFRQADVASVLGL